jgi:hypothetical protein
MKIFLSAASLLLSATVIYFSIKATGEGKTKHGTLSNVKKASCIQPLTVKKAERLKPCDSPAGMVVELKNLSRASKLLRSGPRFVSLWPWQLKTCMRTCSIPSDAILILRECKLAGYNAIRISSEPDPGLYEAIVKAAAEEQIVVIG